MYGELQRDLCVATATTRTTQKSTWHVLQVQRLTASFNEGEEEITKQSLRHAEYQPIELLDQVFLKKIIPSFT